MLKQTLLTLIALAMLLPACKKDTEETIGPTSNITGYVRLNDEFGAILDNASGATVTLQGGENSPTAITDASGKFVFSGITEGNYNLIFSKDNFTKAARYGLAHTAGTENFAGSFSLYKIPQYNIINPSLTYDGEIVAITADTDADQAYYIGLSFATKPNFTTDEAFYSMGTTLETDKTFSRSFTKAVFESYGLTDGDIVYVRLYPSALLSGSLIDPDTGRASMTGFGTPSITLSFTL